MVGELAVLGYFKYADFFLETVNTVLKTEFPLLAIALPIGISFYTFQTLSYTIDVYRGNVGVQRSFLKLATYIALFPQLIAGPIVRYSAVERELAQRRTGIDDLSAGLSRFVIGLSKKVLIANQLGALAVALRATGESSVLMYWLIAAAFALQIYFDFFRLFRYGHWPGAGIRIPFPRKLQLSLYCPQRHGILAALAHLPGFLVPGLCVHPSGRQPGEQAAADGEYFDRVAADGLVARCGLEFCAVGPVFCGPAGAGKTGAEPRAGSGSRCAAARLSADRGGVQLCCCNANGLSGMVSNVLACWVWRAAALFRPRRFIISPATRCCW